MIPDPENMKTITLSGYFFQESTPWTFTMLHIMKDLRTPDSCAAWDKKGVKNQYTRREL